MKFNPQWAKIWDLTIKKENIIFLMHSLLTPFYVPRLPFHASLLVATLSLYQQQALHVTGEIENLKNKKI